MDFASRLARIERELMCMKSNQIYSLGQGKIYKINSQKLQSSLINGSWQVSFSYRFVPIESHTCIMYPRLVVYDVNHNLIPLSEVQRGTYEGFNRLSNYVMENDTLILSCPAYRLSKIGRAHV